MPFLAKRDKKYHPLRDSEDGTYEHQAKSIYTVLPWISTVVLLVLSAYLYLERIASQTNHLDLSSHSRLALGYRTDFGASFTPRQSGF